MRDTLHERIILLEQTLQQLRDRLTTAPTPEKRAWLNEDIQILENSLAYYRASVQLAPVQKN